MNSDKHMQDEKFRALLSGTKVHASSNLKFRIMQQIETEKALSRRTKANESRSVFGNIVSVFGTMYAIIAVIGAIVYYLYGQDALESNTFYTPVIFAGVVCGVVFFIFTFDDRRQSKSRKS